MDSTGRTSNAAAESLLDQRRLDSPLPFPPSPQSDVSLYQQYAGTSPSINDNSGQYERWRDAGFIGSPAEYDQQGPASNPTPISSQEAESESRRSQGGSSTSQHHSLQNATNTVQLMATVRNEDSAEPRRDSSASLRPSLHSAMSNHSQASNSSRDRPSSQSRYRRSPSGRPEVVVPRWQPDVEATICPICHTQFSFFVRKHHCRKCGRVVCASCSPHRITIPYQYIVQPPLEGTPPGPAIARTQPVRDPAHQGNSAEVASLGGGERVRLCNPCVPDPNIAPPQTNTSYSLQYFSQPSRHGRSASGAIPSYGPYVRPQNQLNRQISPISVRDALRSPPRRPREPSILQPPQSSSSYSHSQHPHPRDSSYSHREDLRVGVDSIETRSRSSTVGSISRSGGYHHTSSSSSAVPTSQRYTSMIPRSETDTSRPLPPRPSARPPQIPEEDECWVCHRELPKRTLPNFEALRSQHVESCIMSAMQGSSSSTPPAQATPPQPSSSTSANPSTSANAHTLTNTASTTLPSSNTIPEFPSPAATRRTGVFPYIATEKDCVDDAECTICLEEFEVGVEMGRLECFCRFHRKCIRDWFVTRPGQCPVHQHGGGY